MELAVHPSKLDERRQELFELAVQQAGFFTAGQARALGYSNRLMHHHKRKGNWEEHGWGLYRLNYFPHSQDEDLVRLTLWSRNKGGHPQAVVSHETALRLFELSDVLPDKYHLTVPVGFRKSAPPEVILHWGRLESKDIQQREGFSVTTPLRTLLDVARNSLSLEQVGLAVQEALERGLVRRETLIERREDFPAAYQRVVTKKVLR
jgi:predicted transcriptional regulator of viral defense system